MTVGQTDDAVSRHAATLRLYGHAQLIAASGVVHALERKDAALLAYLALAGPAPRARIAALLWPDVDEDKARTNLRQRLSRLRKTAGTAVADDRGVLALAPSLAVDARAGAADAAVRVETLLGTHDYDDCPEFADWLEGQRTAHRIALRTALAAEAMRLRETDPDRALQTAQSLLALEPESEDAYRVLIELYYLRGDTASALAAYGKCCEMLRRVYGVAPSGETEALVRNVRAPAPAHGDSDGRAIPLALLRPPRMIGRADALAAARRALAARNVLVIAGEAGIGKTRLIEELLAEAPARALHFRARPADALQPWGALRRLCGALLDAFDPALADEARRELARLVPALGPAPEPISSAAELANLHRAVCALVDACHRRGALLLAFDDLQFAGVATVDALRALIRPQSGARGETVTVIVATRIEGASWQAKDLVAALDASPHAQAVLLHPLRLQDTRDLLADVAPGDARWPRLAPALQTHCGGNPAFLLETLKAMLAAPTDAQTETGLPIPATVQAALAQRLERLTDTARAVVELAAVAGSIFSLDLASRALALPRIALAPALREIEAAQIMRGDAFVHDLVEEAALRSIPAARRERLHLQVADFLRRAGAAPALIAHHLVHAGDEVAALPYLRGAVEAAESSLRPDEAARLHEEVARIELAHGDRDAGVAALASAFSMYMATSFVDDANRVFAQWTTLAETPGQRLLLHANRAQQQSGFDYLHEALRHAEAALAILDRQHDAFAPELLVEAFVAVVPALVNAGKATRAVALAERIEPRLDLREAVAEYAYRKGLGAALNAVGRCAEAIDALRRAVELHAMGVDRISEWDTRTRLANYLIHAGRHREAADESQRAIVAGRKQPHFPTTTGTAHYVRAIALAALGEYEEALLYLTSRRDYFRRTGWRFDLGVGCRLALAYLHLGALDAARAALPAEVDLARAKTADRTLHAFAGAALARAAGQPLRPLLRTLLDGEFALNGEEDSLKARVLAAGELPSEAAFDEASAVFERACALHLVPVARSAAIAASRAALALGRVDRAFESARYAVEHAAFCCADTAYMPEAWWIGYEAFAAAGEATAARQCLRLGVEWIDRAAKNHVPAEFGETFRTRNPVNRALLAAAARASVRP